MEILRDIMTELLKQLNPNGKNYMTDVSVITLDDNLQHNYFSSITWQKDNYLPIGTATMIMPYIDKVASYWQKYSGTVIISAKLSSQGLNTNSKDYFTNTVQAQHKKAIEKAKIIQAKKGEELSKEEQEKQDKKNNKELAQRFINDNYNYSYIGKVSRFKQQGQKFVIYLEDLGWKFMQKVPKEFRETFIAGQYLDDAFQAICEFMGIEFAYSIEDLHECTFAPDGYSIQKDGETIEDVPSILREWGAPESDDEEDEDEDIANDVVAGKALGEDAKVNKYTTEQKKKNKNKNKKNNKSKNTNKNNKSKNTNKNNKNNKTSQSTNSNNSSLASSVTNDSQLPNSNATGNEDEENSENDTDSVQDKIDKYQEEFDLKVKDLFIGNTFYDSNLSDPILNYDWITIEPKVTNTNATSSTMGAVGAGATSTNGNGSTNNITGGRATSSLQSRDKVKNGWYNGQLYENNKIVLYSSYINSLGPAQAKAKAQQTGTYTPDTLRRLRIRAQGVRVS